MLGPPSSDSAAWRWGGESCEGGRRLGPTMLFSCDGWDGKSWVGWEELGGEGCWGPGDPTEPVSPPRHLPRAVNGVPTAPRVPALGATGPAPQRTTVASISERSSGPGTARRPPAGLQTVSNAPGRASACGRGSSRGQVGAEAWSPRGELGARTPESEGEGPRAPDSWV